MTGEFSAGAAIDCGEDFDEFSKNRDQEKIDIANSLARTMQITASRARENPSLDRNSERWLGTTSGIGDRGIFPNG